MLKSTKSENLTTLKRLWKGLCDVKIKRQEEEKEKHDGTLQLIVEGCCSFCVGIGGKRWAVFSTNATNFPYIPLKYRSPKPGAGGSSPSTPAIIKSNKNNGMKTLSLY